MNHSQSRLRVVVDVIASSSWMSSPITSVGRSAALRSAADRLPGSERLDQYAVGRRILSSAQTEPRPHALGIVAGDVGVLLDLAFDMAEVSGRRVLGSAENENMILGSLDGATEDIGRVADRRFRAAARPTTFNFTPRTFRAASHSVASQTCRALPVS